MTFAAALIAHEGGWDEVLLVGGPIVAIIGLLALAKRRVDRLQPDEVGHVDGVPNEGDLDDRVDDGPVEHHRRD